MLHSKDRVTDWIENKTHIYAAYKKLTLDLKIRTE